MFKRKGEILVNKWPSSMLKFRSANTLYAAATRPTRVHWLGVPAYSRTQVRSDCGAPTFSITALQAHRRAFLPASLLHSGAAVRQTEVKGVRRAGRHREWGKYYTAQPSRVTVHSALRVRCVCERGGDCSSNSTPT